MPVSGPSEKALRGLPLRDCDRYLWGRSAAKQLHGECGNT